MRNLARAGSRLPEIQIEARSLPDGFAVDALVRSFFLYRPEHQEVIRTVSRMLSDLATLGHVEGDCDDISVFCCAILSAMGIRNRFVAIRYGGLPEFLHVFTEWWSNSRQQWSRMDVTVPFGLIHEENERMVLDVL